MNQQEMTDACDPFSCNVSFNITLENADTPMSSGLAVFQEFVKVRPHSHSMEVQTAVEEKESDHL